MGKYDIKKDTLLMRLPRGEGGFPRAGYITLHERLGKGGMGAVYLGYHEKLEQEFAVKVLRMEAAEEEALVKRFFREAETALRLDHPHLVRAFSIDVQSDTHYIVMEYIDGESADVRVEREGPMPEADALRIARSVGEVLLQAHGLGIVHRDVKPGNIMLRFSDGAVKLTDLGIAKILGEDADASTRLTATGLPMGTPQYMPPEQIQDASRADGRADIYSLGATLYALLSGQPPFKTTSLPALFKKIESEEPEGLREVRPGVTERAAKAVAHMMSKDPSRRPQGMRQVLQMLDVCLARVAAGDSMSLARPKMARKLGPGPEGQEFTLDDLSAGEISAQRRAARLKPFAKRKRFDEGSAGDITTWPVMKVLHRFSESLWTGLVTMESGFGDGEIWLANGGIRHAAFTRIEGEEAVYLMCALTDAAFKFRDGARTDRRTVSGRMGDILSEAKRRYEEVRELLAMRDKAVRRAGIPRAVTIDLGDGVKMEMAYIKPGRFTMGAEEDPGHEVEITKGFYLGKHPVTQAQYERVTGTNPSRMKGSQNPVEKASWNDAVRFCQRLSRQMGTSKGPFHGPTTFRLPTEAEWEYAARAGSTGKYSFGNDEARLAEHAWCMGNSGGSTHPVGQKKPNAWGFYDMHGNVWEWCSDWHEERRDEAGRRKDPTGPLVGQHRVVRGGSWLHPARFCRSAARIGQHPSMRLNCAGFRVAASAAVPAGSRVEAKSAAEAPKPGAKDVKQRPGGLGFAVTNVRSADGTRLALMKITGSIDVQTVGRFQDVMNRFVQEGVKNLILDCAKVKYINSSGLGALLKYVDIFESKGGHIVFTRVPSKVMLVMEMLGFNALFHIVPDEAEAFRLLADPKGKPDLRGRVLSPPRSDTVYVTKTRKKYHRAGCRFLGKGGTPISLKDAKAQGCTPCSVCKPPK